MQPRRALRRAKHSIAKLVEAMGDHTDWRVSDLPEDLRYEFIEHEVTRPAITLVGAKVTHPGAIGQPMEVGAMRVVVSHIAAWWPLDVAGVDYTAPD